MENKIVEIKINWENKDSITAAKKNKKYFKKNGYKLINHFGGKKQTVMILSKIEKGN